MQALLLIDLQVGLCKPGGVGAAALAGVIAENGTLQAAAACLGAAREGGLEVVHVRLAFDPGYRRRTNRTQRFDGHEENRRFVEGSPDVEFCEEVRPAAAELVVSKGSVSPFPSTGLAAWLQARQIREVAICGVATHLAVESAAREGADMGLHVTVVSDACAAPEGLHSHAIENTIPAFAAVVTSADFTRQLQQRAVSR
ncbi:MAG: cysteine hydrolase [Actinomycetota bacterium]|nr:cysteine hydrolase [Actinomycetota bacterium]